MTKTPKTAAPPANLAELAATKEWLDDMMQRLGTTRRQFALTHDIAPSRLQNYVSRAGSKMPDELALWIWNEVQWHETHPARVAWDRALAERRAQYPMPPLKKAVNQNG